MNFLNVIFREQAEGIAIGTWRFAKENKILRIMVTIFEFILNLLMLLYQKIFKRYKWASLNSNKRIETSRNFKILDFILVSRSFLNEYTYYLFILSHMQGVVPIIFCSRKYSRCIEEWDSFWWNKFFIWLFNCLYTLTCNILKLVTFGWQTIDQFLQMKKHSWRHKTLSTIVPTSLILFIVYRYNCSL